MATCLSRNVFVRIDNIIARNIYCFENNNNSTLILQPVPSFHMINMPRVGTHSKYLPNVCSHAYIT